MCGAGRGIPTWFYGNGPPRLIVRSARLHHRKVYEYRYYRGKFGATFENALEGLRPMRDFSLRWPKTAHITCSWPTPEPPRAKPRSIWIRWKYALSAITHVGWRILSCRRSHKKRRHDELQRFMLSTDSVTVAVEVAIFLYPENIDAIRAEFLSRLETRCAISQCRSTSRGQPRSCASCASFSSRACRSRHNSVLSQILRT